MRKLFVIAVLLLPLAAVGCKSQEKEGWASAAGFARMDLADEWAPLETLHERPDMLGSGSTATTIGHTVYVEDLDEWLADRPIGSPRFNASMMHERLHAERQLATGVIAWIARYVTDTDFMWAEEQLGWYIQIRELRRTGYQLNLPGIAATLHGYRNLRGHMVGTAEALAWVEDVLAGRWVPPED